MRRMDGDPELEEFATRVFDLARAGDFETLRAYVDAGVPVNLTNSKGDTLLMLAAYHGHAETVRMLVTSGADPGRANDRGQTPPAGAVFKKESAVVRALLEAGADRGPARRPPGKRRECSQMTSLSNGSLKGSHSGNEALKGSKLSTVAF